MEVVVQVHLDTRAVTHVMVAVKGVRVLSVRILVGMQWTEQEVVVVLWVQIGLVL